MGAVLAEGLIPLLEDDGVAVTREERVERAWKVVSRYTSISLPE